MFNRFYGVSKLSATDLMEWRRLFGGLHGGDLGGETVPAPIVELTCGALGIDKILTPYEIEEFFVAGQKSRINNNNKHSTQFHC
jgi:hypothetical protein